MALCHARAAIDLSVLPSLVHLCAAVPLAIKSESFLVMTMLLKNVIKLDEHFPLWNSQKWPAFTCPPGRQETLASLQNAYLHPMPVSTPLSHSSLFGEQQAAVPRDVKFCLLPEIVCTSRLNLSPAEHERIALKYYNTVSRTIYEWIAVESRADKGTPVSLRRVKEYLHHALPAGFHFHNPQNADRTLNASAFSLQVMLFVLRPLKTSTELGVIACLKQFPYEGWQIIHVGTQHEGDAIEDRGHVNDAGLPPLAFGKVDVYRQINSKLVKNASKVRHLVDWCNVARIPNDELAKNAIFYSMPLMVWLSRKLYNADQVQLDSQPVADHHGLLPEVAKDGYEAEGLGYIRGSYQARYDKGSAWKKFEFVPCRIIANYAYNTSAVDVPASIGYFRTLAKDDHTAVSQAYLQHLDLSIFS